MIKQLKILALLIFFWPSFVYAKDFPATTSYYDINSLDINIQVDQNGNVDVTKKFTFSYPAVDFYWTEDTDIKNLKISASESDLGKQDHSLTGEKDKLIIQAKSKNPSQIWILRYTATESLQPEGGSSASDRLLLTLVLEPNVFINNLSATIHLPFAANENQIKQKVYAIHGVAKSDFSILDSKTLVYSGVNLSPFATYVVQASWPKGFIKYPFLKQASFFIRFLSFTFWINFGAILALSGFLFYFYMLRVQKKDEKLSPSGYIDKPPENLPPALIGLLLREKASAREIAATILDLAERGFLDVVQKRDEYVLGKRQGKGTLRPFEAYLYDKLFTQQGERKIKRTEFELETRATQQLYSPAVSKFCERLYQEAQKRNYFVKNPALVGLKYRSTGVLFFLSAILIAILATKFSSGPPFILFSTFGQILASFFIIKTASLMSRRTKEGKRMLAFWLSFGQFLSDKKPMNVSVTQEGPFNKYLAYAVALGKEVDWAARFAHTTYISPPWYTSEDPVVTLESFAASLFYIAGSVSQTLYNLREPGL